MRKQDLALWFCAASLLASSPVWADTITIDPTGSSHVSDQVFASPSSPTDSAITPVTGAVGPVPGTDSAANPTVLTSATTAFTIDLNSGFKFDFTDTFGSSGTPCNQGTIDFLTDAPNVAYTINGNSSTGDFEVFLEDRTASAFPYSFNEFTGGNRMNGQIPAGTGTLIAGDQYELFYQLEALSPSGVAPETGSLSFSTSTTATPLPTSATAGLALLGVLAACQSFRRPAMRTSL